MIQRKQCHFRILSFLEEYLPKDFLDIIVGGEDVKAAKPSPKGVLFALEHLGSTPKEILYIGDSTVDAECRSGFCRSAQRDDYRRRTSSLSALDDNEKSWRVSLAYF